MPRGNFVVVGVKRSFTIETTHHHDGTRSLASTCVPQLLCRRRFPPLWVSFLDAPPTFSKMKSSVRIFWFNVQGHHSHLRLYTLVESQQLARENTASNNPSQFVVVVVIIKTKKQV